MCLLILQKLDDGKGGEVAKPSSKGVLGVGDHAGPNGTAHQTSWATDILDEGVAEKEDDEVPSGSYDNDQVGQYQHRCRSGYFRTKRI